MYKGKNNIENRKLSDYLIPIKKVPVSDTSKYKKIRVKLNLEGVEAFDSSRDYSDTRPFYVRKKGELIIGKQNFFNGSIAIIPDKFDGSICSNAIMSFDVVKIDKRYFYYNISRKKYLNLNSSKANGTGQKELSERDFLNFDIVVHNKIETQNQIGSFLSAIDELINLQKNKIFLLKKKLDYYIDSLTRSTISFKNKSLVEFKTIDYYADVKSGGTPDTNNPNYWGGEIPWFTPTEIGEYKYVETSSSYLSKDGLMNSSASEIPPNSILLTSRATIGEAAINLVSCTTNQGFQNLIPKSQTDLNFLYYIIRTLKSEFKKYSNGSTFSEISKKTISKIKVPYFDYEYQKKIGSFLSLIDERISKEKEKLNLYTNLKKYYLKEIFQ
jgi:type I restriction enzyme S subunit